MERHAGVSETPNRKPSLPVIAEVPTIKEPIKPSPGFAKKLLSQWKLDLIALCQFACIYCSSNWGYYLRIQRELFAQYVEQQTGKRMYPDSHPELMLIWPEILENLESQLAHKKRGFGRGATLVVSMLTDAFSPWLVESGVTEKALKLVLERTEFRIRVLTKNACVGRPPWIRFFQRYPGRFVVGLSTGTMDNEWAKKVEIGTSPPSARLRALRALQGAGVPTFAMACPIFPDAMSGDGLELLVDEMRPQHVEHVWAEPYNDRSNWEAVRSGYEPGSPGWDRITEMFSGANRDAWSEYATEQYVRLRAKAAAEGWLHKLRFLLYEDRIAVEHAARFGDLQGVLLQTKPGADGLSQNPHIRALQLKHSGNGVIAGRAA